METNTSKCYIHLPVGTVAVSIVSRFSWTTTICTFKITRSCHRFCEMSNLVKTGAFLIERFEPQRSARPVSYRKYISKDGAGIKTYLKLDKFGWTHMHQAKRFLSNLSACHAMRDIVHIYKKFGYRPAYMLNKWQIQKVGGKSFVNLP